MKRSWPRSTAKVRAEGRLGCAVPVKCSIAEIPCLVIGGIGLKMLSFLASSRQCLRGIAAKWRRQWHVAQAEQMAVQAPS